MRVLRVLAVVTFLAPIAGCHKNPAGPAETYDQTISGSVTSFGVTSHTLDIPRDGNLRLTLSWQGAVDLDLYLTATSCTNIYGETACQKLAASDATSGQSEMVSWSVTKGAGLKAWVDNFTGTSLSYSLRVQID